jgi:hypothetical protein
MQIKFRTLAPALLIATFALAGCQTTGKKTDAGAQAPAATQGGAPAPVTPSTTLPPAGSKSPAAASSIGFFIAQTDPAADLMTVKLSDGTVYVQRQPVLTRADLTEAAALVDRQGKNFVGLRFTEAGARKLTQVSTQNVGKLLVLVIDGQLVAAPRIAEPLNRGVLAFGVDSAQAASDIAARVRGDTAPAAGQPASSSPAAPSAPAAAPMRQQ